jgi:hypothetical protein
MQKKQGVTLENQVQEKQQKSIIAWLRRNTPLLSVTITAIAVVIAVLSLLRSFGYL